MKLLYAVLLLSLATPAVAADKEPPPTLGGGDDRGGGSVHTDKCWSVGGGEEGSWSAGGGSDCHSTQDTDGGEGQSGSLAAPIFLQSLCIGKPTDYLISLGVPIEACPNWDIQPYICRSTPLFRPDLPAVPSAYLHDLGCVPERPLPSIPREKRS